MTLSSYGSGVREFKTAGALTYVRQNRMLTAWWGPYVVLDRTGKI